MKILFFPRSSGLAHLLRCMAIAAELSQRGHKILFAAAENKTAFIRQAGWPNHVVTDFPEEDMGKLMFSTLFSKNKTQSILKKMIVDDLEVIQKYQPDFLVMDTRYSMMITRQLINLPLVSIAAANHFPEYEQYIPWLSQGIIRTSKKIVLKLANLTTRRIYQPLAQEFKVQSPNSIYDLYQADLRLLPEVPGYTLFAKMPSHTFYVGPLFWPGFGGNDNWQKRLSPHKKIIYVTLGGTVFKKKIFEKIIKTLAEENHQVIVSTGSQFNPEDFAIENENVIKEKYLNGEKACSLAHLVICPGGQGTVMQALKYGVPLLTIPHNLSQYHYARCVVRLGCGLMVLNRFMILKKIKRLLNNSRFQKDAQKLKKEIANYPGASLAAEIITKTLRIN